METKYEKGDQLEIEQINKTMKKKKLSRGMHVFSVVMFMLRRRRRRKSFNTGFWRRVVESVRNVHSEITIMPSSKFINTIVLPPAPPPPPPATETGQDGGDDDNDNDDDDSGDRLSEAIEVFTAASSSSSSGISGYGSAMSLRDLDYHYDDDVECYSDVEGGDDMIDEKAEEFIVRFYEQMKMQYQVYTERCKAKGIVMN